jgi:DNA-binding response OmpR family regulator
MSDLGRVLIIDDEASLRQTLTRVLQRAGFEVSSVKSGVEALQRISTQSFHLVYLDIRMPEMSGLEVLREIRSTHPELPVILLTAHASLQSALDAIRLGARDYLVKPIDPEVFVAQTRIILQEQIVELRKQELREKITALRAELQSLEETEPDSESPTIVAPLDDSERFLKRGLFVLDLRAQRATLGERVLSLTPTAFAYLTVLIRHAPSAVDYKTLVTEAQGYDVDHTEAGDLAKYHIHVLRQTLDVNLEQAGHIINVRGVGYRLLTD